jgi:hypothetical protein
MNFPIFVLTKDCGEVTRFNSIEELQSQLEEIDVENGEYAVWDRTGTSLKMSVQKPLWLHIEPEELKPHQSDLRDALKQYAAALGIQEKLEGISDGDFESVFAQISVHLDRKKRSRNFLRRIIRRPK